MQLNRLKELKPFCNEIGKKKPECNLPDAKWKQIDELIKPFKLFSDKMTALQKEDLSLSDAFGHWLELELELKQLQQTNFVTSLTKNLSERKAKLLENEIMLSCLYLDPKFNCILTSAQKKIAVNHLTKLYQRFKLTSCCDDTGVLAETNTNGNADTANENTDIVNIVNETVLQKYLKSLHIFDENAPMDDVKSIIEGFKTVGAPNVKLTSFEYWLANQNNHPPALMELARIIYATSATEVCVERNFSKLGFVLNKYRCSLSDGELEKILLLNLNDI